MSNTDPRFPEPRMRDGFRKELRAHLMQQAPALLVPRRDNAWTFLRPAVAVGLAGLVLLTGAGTAAAGSTPGDPAFVLKKAFEDAQVNLTFDDVQRVQLLAQIADRRLEDLQRVANTVVTTPNSNDAKTVAASEEFADAVLKFRSLVDQVQTVATPDKSDRVQQVVETAREQHGAVVDEIQQQVNDGKAKDALERAKTEEGKDTKEEQGLNGPNGNDPTKTLRPARTAAPSRSPRPSASPRPSDTGRGVERTESPRVTATPRPTGSPRFAPSPRASGDAADPTQPD